MGNYNSGAEVQDASYGLYSFIDESDKGFINRDIHIKTLTLYKNTADGLSTDATSDFPVLTADAPIRVISCAFIPSATVPSNVANWATFLLKRYFNGAAAAVPVIAQRSTSTAPDGGAASAFLPYYLTFFTTETGLLAQNEVLALGISKNVNGQIVPAGVWEIKYKYA